MKAIRTRAVISSIRSKVDGSLGLTVSTPEMTNEEKVEFMGLQNVDLDVLFSPFSQDSEELMIVDRRAGGKTPSERLRAVIYIYWEQSGKPSSFEQYYASKMDVIINKIKDKLL